MERRKFFSVAGLGATSLLLTNSFQSCKKETDSDEIPNGNVPQPNKGITLDLNNASYSALKVNGGFVTLESLIVARTSTGSLVAVSKVCTHQGCTVGFDGVSKFPCPCHGSIFDSNGNVLQGPATEPLKKYTASLSNDVVTISVQFN